MDAVRLGASDDLVPGRTHHRCGRCGRRHAPSLALFRSIVGTCHRRPWTAGPPPSSEEVLRRLRRILPVDSAFFATVDPMTLLFTSAAADEPLGAATPLFLDNEFGREDV